MSTTAAPSGREEESGVITSADEAVAVLPDGDFLLVTIVTSEGWEARRDAAILVPKPAHEVFAETAIAEYGGAPCLALVWAETLEPYYSGHPGSIWPVTEYRRRGSSVDLVGERGTATFRTPPPGQLAHLRRLAEAVGYRSPRRARTPAPGDGAIERGCE